MGSLSEAELSLDFRPATPMTTMRRRMTTTTKEISPFVLYTMGELLKEVSVIGDSSEKACRLDGFLEGLEEEMRKIDSFKRELPLCMLLLNDAIVFLKEELLQYRGESPKRKLVLEEFIPLKKNSDNDDGVHHHGKLDCPVSKKERDSVDKKNWMRSVQLWSSSDDHHRPSTDCFLFDSKHNSKFHSKANNEEENEYVDGDRSGTTAGLFMPFKSNDRLSSMEGNVYGDELPVPGLSLLTSGARNLKEELGSTTSCGREVLSFSAPNSQLNVPNGLHVQSPQLQTARKQRRCWSPELHRRFVNALQQLGGCQAATPKQIRELMQVDGLTNDEVKSHLQKYRLHTRRMPAAATQTLANQSTVVLGGLRMSHDQCGEFSRGTSSQSGSPHGPLDLTGTSTTGAENMEDDEDAKSEGYSWKSHVHKVDV